MNSFTPVPFHARTLSLSPGRSSLLRIDRAPSAEAVNPLTERVYPLGQSDGTRNGSLQKK